MDEVCHSHCLGTWQFQKQLDIFRKTKLSSCRQMIQKAYFSPVFMAQTKTIRFFLPICLIAQVTLKLNTQLLGGILIPHLIITWTMKVIYTPAIRIQGRPLITLWTVMLFLTPTAKYIMTKKSLPGLNGLTGLSGLTDDKKPDQITSYVHKEDTFRIIHISFTNTWLDKQTNRQWQKHNFLAVL